MKLKRLFVYENNLAIRYKYEAAEPHTKKESKISLEIFDSNSTATSLGVLIQGVRVRCCLMSTTAACLICV
jgi:hypothetical protein